MIKKFPSKFLRYRGLFVVVGVILLYLGLQWRLWITKELIFSHDSIRWYGMFAYLADSFVNGTFPYWNPYMNCGEPFFLNLSILRLEDPTTFILLYLGKFFKINFLTLYHYDLLLRYFIFIIGCYLFFKSIAAHKKSAIIAFIAISFSSLAASYLRQHNLLLNIYLLPWFILFSFKFLEEKSPIYLIGIAFILGILIPSYTFMYTVSFAAILFISLSFTKGIPWPRLSMFKKDYKMTLLAILILLLLSLRVIPIALTYNDVIPTVRLFEVTYSAYSRPLDFLNLFAPYFFKWHIYMESFKMSEAFLYIGLIPLLLSILGLFFSKHRYKIGFIITTVFIGLLMLGEGYFVFPLMKKVFPFFYMIRNMQGFAPFFIFCLSYFVCVGVDTLYDLSSAKKNRRVFNITFILASIFIIAMILFSILYFPYLAKLLGALAYPERFSVLITDCRYYSIFNTVLFVFGAIALFFFFIKKRREYLGTFIIVTFILIDLILFNRILYHEVVQERPQGDGGFPSYATRTVYKNYRIPKTKTNFPFVAAVLKEPAAYHEYYMYGTHFFETKDFFKFNTSSVPDAIKNIWAGIYSPRLYLVPRCIIGSGDDIAEASKRIRLGLARKLVFIEEDLPQRYSHLKTSLKNLSSIENPELGKIKVRHYNPNELALEVDSKQDCFLYYGDGYDKSWRGFIDGKEDKVYKANLAFKAIIVPRGNHEVRFLYDPKFYKVSLFCYFVGMLVLVAVSIKTTIAYFKGKAVRR